jgi:hypothetical protein
MPPETSSSEKEADIIAGIATHAALERDPLQIADGLDYVNWLVEAGQVERRAWISRAI